MKLIVNSSTGLLSALSCENTTIPLKQTLEYYVAEFGNNQGFGNRSSGAYIFRPKFQESVKIADKVNATIYEGRVSNYYS